MKYTVKYSIKDHTLTFEAKSINEAKSIAKTHGIIYYIQENNLHIQCVLMAGNPKKFNDFIEEISKNIEYELYPEKKYKITINYGEANLIQYFQATTQEDANILGRYIATDSFDYLSNTSIIKDIKEYYCKIKNIKELTDQSREELYNICKKIVNLNLTYKIEEVKNEI